MTKTVSGEEALARGALSAGVNLVTGYPGSPSSGAFESFLPLADRHGLDIEWSGNERVALEVAIGASIAGNRALVCVKSVGMNVFHFERIPKQVLFVLLIGMPNRYPQLLEGEHPLRKVLLFNIDHIILLRLAEMT